MNKYIIRNPYTGGFQKPEKVTILKKIHINYFSLKEYPVTEDHNF